MGRLLYVSLLGGFLLWLLLSYVFGIDVFYVVSGGTYFASLLGPLFLVLPFNILDILVNFALLSGVTAVIASLVGA
jgi:hypothetical protein